MSLMIRDAISMAAGSFEKAGSLSPKKDAEILLCYLLQVDYSWVFTHYSDPLDDRLCDMFFELMDRRTGGEPVQYITGVQEFMGLSFKVTPDVLIPRQDTETLVETAAKAIQERKEPFGGFEVLDLCCGSGAIAISLSRQLPNTKMKITASDISAPALAIARENAAALASGRDIRFVESDLFSAFPKDKKGRGKKLFDFIISNPPYIPSAVLPTLQREVYEHEPLSALDGGPDGLDFYIAILAEAPFHLEKDGVLLMEIGHDQGPALLALLDACGGFQPGEIIQDLAGHDRVVWAKKKLA